MCVAEAGGGGGGILKKALALLRLCVFCFPLIPFEEVVNTTLEFPQQEKRGQEGRHSWQKVSRILLAIDWG